jgi:hypothetical protein
MKKYILLVIAFLGFALQGQTAIAFKGSSGATSDTVTNAGTEYLTITSASNVSIQGIQYVADKISGTVGGTVTLEASINGDDWLAIDTATTLKKGLDSYTNTDVAKNQFFWFVSRPAYVKYRLKIVGTGTMVLRVRAWIIGKNEY